MTDLLLTDIRSTAGEPADITLFGTCSPGRVKRVSLSTFISTSPGARTVPHGYQGRNAMLVSRALT